MKKHLFYYLSLILILSAGISLAIQVAYDKQLEMLVVLTTVALYIMWGILHHFFHHDITAKIVVEYVLMGSLGLTAVFFLLKGGF